MPAAHPLLLHLFDAAQQSLDAAAGIARAAGYEALILSSSMEGEARELALVHAGMARQVLQHGQPLAAPCVILSGGQGRDGRHAEFLLALAVALDGLPGVHAIAADTDGAWLAPGTLARARTMGLDAHAHLADQDGDGFFGALGQLIVTSPTHIHLNDFRALVIETDVL